MIVLDLAAVQLLQEALNNILYIYADDTGYVSFLVGHDVINWPSESETNTVKISFVII